MTQSRRRSNGSLRPDPFAEEADDGYSWFRCDGSQSGADMARLCGISLANQPCHASLLNTVSAWLNMQF